MAKKAAPKAAEPKAASAGTGTEKKAKSRTKAEIYAKLAESSGLTKKQIATVFDSLSDLIKNELGKKGPGLFVVPGLLKIKVVRKPATKAQRKMNPFTKQMQDYPAKPARNVVKALPLKSLKEMV
jgi:nucleoid DNA-binding protein